VTASAPPAPRKPPRLVLRFAAYSAIALALAWVGIFWVVTREAEERGRGQVTAHATEVAARIAPSLTRADFGGPVSAERRAELDDLFERELVGHLLRMKLWSRDGVVTYSTEHALIGERARDRAELQPPLAGRPVQEVSSLNEESTDAGGEDTKAFESYVPVRMGDPGKPTGVLEVYEAYAPVAAEVHDTVTPVAVALGLALLLLYATLFPILRQVTKALDNRHKGLEQHAAALTQALSERDRAEVRVGEAERNYRSLVEQLPLVMYMTRLDETSSCLYMSPQIEDLVGYTPLECMSDAGFFVEILHPDDRERTLAAHREAYAAGESFAITYRMIAKDGRPVWVHDEVTIAKDDAGRPTHAKGFLVDVTAEATAQEERERQHAERLRAEHALEEAELRYRTLVEHLPLVTYISPADESVGNLYVSPQVETMLGYPAEEWIENPNLLHQAVHPDDLERVLADAARLRETGEAQRSEYRYVAADGRVVWVLDETILVRDEAGTPLWVQGFLVDITESKVAEETRARLASIVESSNDAITSATLDLSITSWNAGAERIFGYAAEDVVGTPITLLLPDDRQEEALEALRRVVTEDRVAYLDTVRAREHGGPVHVAFTYSPIHDSEGAVVGVSAIGQDVTERKRAEEAIRESESKFRAFVETTEEWVWAMDMDGRHSYSNPAIERILGYRPEEIVGKTRYELVIEADREELAWATGARAERREGWSGVVVRCLHRDGSVRFLESAATPELDAAGELVGWRGTDRDVTHRIQAEADRDRLLIREQEARAVAEAAQRDLASQNERLRELDRLKDEFIALVSHELRTPLTSIRGYTELLLDCEAGDLTDEQRRFLGVVERNSHRLLHLVGDLLFLAQIEAGKLVLEMGAVDLAAVASESVETARPQAEAKGITLTLATGPVPSIAGDRARISQLLDNLVSNAIKFTSERGRVDVRVRIHGKQAVVDIRDSGMGIPAAEQQFLFERFFRTSTATEQAIQGTGLGLAISKAIVDAHSGLITVTSREGAGTTFRVSLPLGSEAELPEPTEVAS
jgi:PAS domain S-box-containing protein